MLSKRDVYNQVNIIHVRIQHLINDMMSGKDKYNMAYVLAYNEHVENHKLLIPTFGNLIIREINNAPVNTAVKTAYEKLCWNEEEFEYPASEQVWDIISTIIKK